MPSINSNDIIKLYTDEKKSPYEIAEIYNTYPNKIRRILAKFVKLRDKSEAQKEALKTGRLKHPTEGTERSEETKIKISNKVHNYWKNLTPDELEEHVKDAKKRWANLSDAHKADMQDKAHKAVRIAAKEGSKLEKSIFDALVEAGYKAQFHRKNLVVNEKLEADIYIPELSIIIEVDGPSHFLPIWGDDKLKQVMKADADKVGLAISKGFVVIRIKCLADNLVDRHKRQAKQLVLSAVHLIKTKLPPKKQRFIQLEVDE